MPISPSAPFYVEGREAAADGFDANDYDIEVLVGRVLGSEELHVVCKQAIAADLATDAHDGTRDAWLAEHEEECEEAGVDPAHAYEEWCRGYMDRGSYELESVMEDAFDEACDDVTAVETPAAKAGTKKFSKVTRANPVSDRGTQDSYADWYATGIQDCQNSWDATELDDELNAAAAQVSKKTSGSTISKLAEKAVDDYWQASEAAGSAKAWERQNAADIKADGLDVSRAYIEWADGWKQQARSYAAQEITRRAAD